MASSYRRQLPIITIHLIRIPAIILASLFIPVHMNGADKQMSDAMVSFPMVDGPSQCKEAIPVVYLTISPQLYQRGFFSRGTRKLQMNWILCNRKPNSGDTVRLYWQDPSLVRDFNARSESDQELDRRFPALSGRYLTNTIVPEFNFNDYDLLSNDCLDFWVAYVTYDGHMLAKSCLARKPRWMEQLREAMSNLKLAEVAIPGTHNAGSYSGYTDMVTETVRNKFLINQEESIFDQLVLGIRYLDIRVGYYPHTSDKFFVNHDKVRIQPLQRVLDDITRFLTKTNEIIILDFHRFPVGFNPEVHEELISFILSQPSWARLALPKSPRRTEITLGEMWSSGHRLVIAYEDEAAENGNEFLWENVIHLWANTLDTNSLHKYLSRSLGSARQSLSGKILYTANAFLTPQISDVFGGIQAAGLRVLADEVNRNGLDRWFASEWRNNFTIVSTDFFLSNRMVALCEEVNAERAHAVRLRVDHRRDSATEEDSMDMASSTVEYRSARNTSSVGHKNSSPILRAVTRSQEAFLVELMPTSIGPSRALGELLLPHGLWNNRRSVNNQQLSSVRDRTDTRRRANGFAKPLSRGSNNLPKNFSVSVVTDA